MRGSTFAFPFLTASLSLASGASGQHVWVDVISGDDLTGTGAKSAPFATIGKGVQVLGTVAGPTILHVEPGSYGPSTGEAFPIVIPPQMTIRGDAAATTQVSGEGNGVVLFRLDRESVVSDLTLTRADVAIESSGPGFASNVRVVRRCVVHDSGVGLHCSDGPHADLGTIVLNSLFFANDVAILAESTGYDFQSTSVLVYGSTITKNANGLVATGVLERYLGLFDSIVYGNGSDAISNWSAIFPGITGNVLGDPTYVGTGGNVGLDPLLVEPASGDGHLRVTSPAVDLSSPPVAWPPAPAWLGPATWVWEWTYEEIAELDGDDRIGVTTDPGADELVVPTLYAHGRTRVGQTFRLRVTSHPNEPIPVFAAAGLLSAPIGGFFWLAAPAVPIATMATDGDGLADLPIAVPNVPAWVGLDAHLQGFRSLGGGAYEGTRPVRVRLQP
ncbi:MAG: DUF1565 domain-containing protein [Planctomycetota bacterium JB042]